MLHLKRVYVLDEQIVAITLRSDYHIVLGHNLNGPTEMSVDPFLYTHGSDGRRSLSGSNRVLVFVIDNSTGGAQYRRVA